MLNEDRAIVIAASSDITDRLGQAADIQAAGRQRQQLALTGLEQQVSRIRQASPTARYAATASPAPPACGSDCAGRTLQPVAEPHCPVCSQALAPGQAVAATGCALPEAEREFSGVDAVAVYSEALRDTIHKPKYEGPAGQMIFGRLLVGRMEAAPR
ncbi:hypothetical protein ACF1BE_29070 [Streptomyces sp. NPDC014991]|uniref:hypothetical protein n=1 Tax=Streptomyces sp. NPDC014991 TaxID=3364935 RepID=UPI0036F7EFB7